MRQASKKRPQNRPQPLQKSSSFLHARGRNRAFMTAPVTPASHARHNHALPCPHPHMHRKGRLHANKGRVLRACAGKQAPCEGSQGYALHLPQHALRLAREVSGLCSPAPLPQKPCSLLPAIHHQRQGTDPGSNSGDGNGPVTPTHLEYRQYVSERDREHAAAAGDCDQ